MTRAPSTCGCSSRVRSGLPPREDRTSNPVGPVRDVIGLVGRRRLFRAVRQIRPTKMSDVHAEHAMGASMDPTDPWGTLGAHVVKAKGRARRRGCKCT